MQKALKQEAYCRRSLLERKRYAAADGTGGLDEVDGLTVLAKDWHIALRQKIAQVDDGFHVAAQGADRLTEEEVQKRIALSGRGVEHVDRGDSRAIHPSVRCDPAGVSAGSRSTQLRGDRMPALRDHKLLGILQRDVGVGKVENSAVAVIYGAGEIVGKFVLQHESQAVGVERSAGIGEGTGRNIRDDESARGSGLSGAG